MFKLTLVKDELANCKSDAKHRKSFVAEKIASFDLMEMLGFPITDLGPEGEEQLRLIYRDLISEGDVLVANLTNFPRVSAYVTSEIAEDCGKFIQDVKKVVRERKQGEVPLVVVNMNALFTGLKLLK